MNSPRTLVICLAPARLGLISAFSILLLLSPCQSAIGFSKEGEDTVDFQSSIAPILAEHCTHCHGVDENTRQGGLRLDTREGALAALDSGVHAVVPGDPSASELLKRIRSSDEGEIMPPPSENKPLSDDQIKLLQRWIEQGANYETHWGFAAPVRPDVPASEATNPIDSFIVSKSKSHSLEPKMKAPEATIIRRLYLDLIGLPPSPDELEQAIKDGYAVTIDKLLSSERYGEKWGRVWLDLARFSDTNGYEKDMPREQWKYRDWVIDALNNDMPYDQFIIEQIAGDLLPNATQSQMIATGFLRNSMINEEGAIVAEQFRLVELIDRIDCVGKAVLGVTVQCAQCHSHKFDPISHDEYFGLFAYLNNVYEAQSWVYTDPQLEQIASIQKRLKDLASEIVTQHPDWEKSIQPWAEETAARNQLWKTLTFHQRESVSGLNHPTQESDGSILMKGHVSNDVFLVAKPGASTVSSLRLEILPHGDLPFNGPGRSALGTWGITNIEVWVRHPEVKDFTKLKIAKVSADYSNAEVKGADEKKKTGPVDFVIDDNGESVWIADRGVGQRNQASLAILNLESPIELQSESEIKFVMNMTDMVGCCRVSVSDDVEQTAAPVDFAVQQILHNTPDQWSQSDRDAVLLAWARKSPELKSFADREQSIRAEFPTAETSILHLREREPENKRTTYLLDRGEWNLPKHEVQPHVPAEFHPLPENSENNRLAFARWLVDKRSPVTARVAVNRIWQTLFGIGLNETPDDFGTRSPLPVQRELLDWLAVEFMESGWSQKHILRQIVQSEAYQRSSVATAEERDQDPKNQFLARGPRFRSDAEAIRDIALGVSGLLHNKLGGKSVIPPVPQNVLDYNYVYPSYWQPAEGSERYRRTVYGFRKRSMPDPVASSLDAPNGDFACAMRVRSNTPLAALVTMNEPIFVEAARALGLRILREGGDNDTQRIQHAFKLCLSREASPQEVEVVTKLLNEQRKQIAEGWLNPRELVTGNAATLPELPANSTPQDAAAWMIVSRVLLNLDETISKN